MREVRCVTCGKKLAEVPEDVPADVRPVEVKCGRCGKVSKV